MGSETEDNVGNAISVSSGVNVSDLEVKPCIAKQLKRNINTAESHRAPDPAI